MTDHDEAMLDRRFAVDDVELAWNRWGSSSEGSPLVLCHGFSGSTHDFASHLEFLARDRPVYAADHRGHGLSTKLHRVDGYSLERLTNDLVSFIEEVVAEPVDLLGHSMGGNIALRATLLRPELVRSLILMDTTAGSFQPRDPDIRAAFGSFVERFDPTRGMPELASRNTPEDELITQRTTEAWRNAKTELGRQFDPYAFKALATELFSETNSSVESRLGEIHRPTTVLVGSLDHPLVDVAPELAERIEVARLVVIDGAYHSPQLTHPHEWRRAVTDHLDR